MICGIGIDSVEIKRFSEWQYKSIPQLKKIFSEAEIEYCLKNKLLSAQRFAVRFAVREAFFKALCAMNPSCILPFLSVCKAITLSHTDNQVPVLHIEWSLLGQNKLNITYKNLVPHVSLTHAHSLATAIVILERL